MTVRSNIHTHTRYSDGKNTPEEMIRKAMSLAFRGIGFSDHGYAPYDPVSMNREQTQPYIEEINRLKEKYKGKIEVYLGFEADYYAPVDAAPLDFVIGSIHYLRHPETEAYHCLDHTPEHFEKAIQAFGGVKNLIRVYYGMAADLAVVQQPDVIGHFDLITKFNDGHAFFDPTAPWYLDAAVAALKQISGARCVIEVNTGTIAKGYTQAPYPSKELLACIKELQIPLMLSADAHTADTLDYYFDEATLLLKSLGFRSVVEFTGNGFAEIAL